MSHPPSGRDQGSAPEPEPFAFPALQKAVEQKDRWTFTHLARALPWQDYRASDLLQAIDWALALDAIETAKNWPSRAGNCFPIVRVFGKWQLCWYPPFSWERAPANRPD